MKITNEVARPFLPTNDMDVSRALYEALGCKKLPRMQPWGQRVAFVYDPCGVLWHVCERRPGNVAD